MVDAVEHIVDPPFVRVLLVDDHAFVPEMLERLFVRSDLFEVVGKAGSAEEALEILEDVEADVVIMDIDMPGLDCFQAVKRILHRSSRVRVLLLSAHVQDRFIDQALKARASAYVTKTEPPEALVAAVRTVAAGGTYFSSEIRERLAVEGERGAVIVGADNVKSRSALLTAREVEILGLVACRRSRSPRSSSSAARRSTSTART
jgi:DNA-binding NarL/FixJ family response regulator